MKKIDEMLFNLVDDIYQSYYFTNHGPAAKELESIVIEKSGFKYCTLISANSLGIIIGVDSKTQGFDCVDFEDSLHCSKKIYYDFCEKKQQTGLDKRLFVSSKKWFIDHGVEGDDYDSYLVLVDGLRIEKKWNLIPSLNILCDLNGLNAYSNVIDFDLGCCLLTNNRIDSIIHQNMRSSYGAQESNYLRASCNARYSEVQALMCKAFLMH